MRPNILFILADDLGYGDLSCSGRPDYRTPVLDALAAQGLKFLSAYAAAPLCTPTRCAFATGRYPQRPMDWMATMLVAAGATPDAAYPLDGEDLLPVCSGRRAPYDRSLFWRTIERDAARVGKWKYVRNSDSEHLFDVVRDPGETSDLRATHRAEFDAIKRQFEAWKAALLPRPA